MTTNRRKNGSRQAKTPKIQRLTSDDDDASEDSIKNSVPLIDKVPLRRSQSFPNLSVQFADTYAFWLYYLCILFLSWYSFFLLPTIWPTLTVMNIIHGIVKFLILFSSKFRCCIARCCNYS